jgi:putative restriction endonuclease
MNPLFHKAFDKFLFTVTPQYTIEISEEMIDGAEETFRNYLVQLNGKAILMPEKFSPDKNLLLAHYEQYRTKR